MIEGILFDSGDVLMTPTHGGWFPKPRFAELISAHGLPVPQPEAVDAALDAGMTYLSRHHRLRGLDDEVRQFDEYYRIVLGRLFVDYPVELGRELALAAVFECDQAPFADTERVLFDLREAGLRLGVLSNAGPSLSIRYEAMGLRDVFDIFVISALVGLVKPDPRIYQIALEQLDLPAASVAFIDDDPDNVDTATELGMLAVVMDRYHALTGQEGRPTVSDLAGFVTRVGLA